MRVVTFLVLLGLLVPRAHANLLEDFDALGGNDALLEQAQSLQPESEVRIVQERPTPRRLRSEFTLGYSYFFSGDVYLQTQSADLSYQLHITPRWAIGAHYFSALNRMTDEGVTLTQNDLPVRLPEDSRMVLDLDPLQSGYHGSVSFFPLYGKFSLLNLGVVHFDAYVTAGYGQVQLTSGNSDSYLVGGGLALWLSKNLSARFELRSQMYEASRTVGGEQLTRTAGSFHMGYLL